MTRSLTVILVTSL